jgi:hypothetical protein
MVGATHCALGDLQSPAENFLFCAIQGRNLPFVEEKPKRPFCMLSEMGLSLVKSFAVFHWEVGNLRAQLCRMARERHQTIERQNAKSPLASRWMNKC